MQAAGTPLPRLPVDLTWTRDLEGFDGPLLSEFCSASGDTYLYSWCDSDKTHNRWMVLRTSPRSLIEYLHRKITLFKLIESAQDGFVYFVDMDGDATVRHVALVRLSEIPEAYWPAPDSWHDNDLRPRAEQQNSRQEVLIQGQWDMADFGLFPRRYSQVYAFIYMMNSGAQVPPAFHFRYRRGFPIVKLFTGLLKQLPVGERPVVSAIQYMSPGFIRLQANPSISAKVYEAIETARARREAIREAYRAIREYEQMDLSDGMEGNFRAALEHMADVLGLIDIDRLLTMVGGYLSAAKVLGSYHRFLEELARYEDDGKVTFV